MTYEFNAPLWLWNGEGAWHFVNLPVDIGNEIKDEFASERRGFGAVRVNVTIGQTSWSTSIFPDRKSGSFVLPVKKAVRVAEEIDVDDVVSVRLEVPET